MRIEKKFEAKCPREVAVEIAARDETLLELFAGAKTEIVAREAERKTTCTHYTALGRSGSATFHFTFLPGGDVEFEKECDGNVWRELRGSLSFRTAGERTRVRVEMDGRTRPLVPEFTIKGAMREQLEQMARALRQQLEIG